MRIEIRWKGTPRRHALDEYTKERARFALGRFADHLEKVRVRLEDVNGPRGGLDKRCVIELHTRLGVRVVEARDTHFHAAVDRAMDIGFRTLGRYLGQHRHYRDEGLQAPEL